MGSKLGVLEDEGMAAFAEVMAPAPLSLEPTSRAWFRCDRLQEAPGKLHPMGVGCLNLHQNTSSLGLQVWHFTPSNRHRFFAECELGSVRTPLTHPSLPCQTSLPSVGPAWACAWRIISPIHLVSLAIKREHNGKIIKK